MFKRKNALISLAVALLISACGGGGGDDPSPSTTTPPPATNPGTGNNPPDGGNNPPPATVDNEPMAGNLQLLDPAVIFNGTPINVSQFEANEDLPNGAGSFARGTNAPIQTFGLGVESEGMDMDGAGQTKRVRMAIDLTEEAGTVAAGEEAEVLQFMIDQVDLAVSATNELSVTVPSTAKLYVYTKNSSGGIANMTVADLPADAVRLVDVPEVYESRAITIDFDAIFARLLEAAQGDTARLAVFNSVKDFTGTFGMSSTISNVAIQKTGDGAATGADITVTNSDQPAVTGGGLVGRLWVE
jgi:hypothetical protein